MASLNQVTLIGNVGRDPEIRYLPSGDAVATFSLATSESWKDKSGEKQERTEWHKIDVFGKLAEVVQSYVTKGSKLYVQGQLVYNEWEKDGVKRTTASVKLGFNSKLIMLGESKGVKSSKAIKPKAESEPEGDDVPF